MTESRAGAGKTQGESGIQEHLDVPERKEMKTAMKNKTGPC